MSNSAINISEQTYQRAVPRACDLTLPPQLILDGLHSSLLLDEVVDDLGRLSVLELGLRDAAHVEQVLQLRVQVVQLQETSQRSPTHFNQG